MSSAKAGPSLETITHFRERSISTCAGFLRTLPNDFVEPSVTGDRITRDHRLNRFHTPTEERAITNYNVSWFSARP
jgi:hypothetical protein